MSNERGLAERIEAAYDEAKQYRETMLYARRNLDEMQVSAKLDHAEEWAAAKNADVRAVLLVTWLEEDEQYGKNIVELQEARIGLRLALLEIERLKLLVELAKASLGDPA